MHLLVLNAFRPEEEGQETILRIRSQCTFWRSVLSDRTCSSSPTRILPCLNAPSGAQCFPTSRWVVEYAADYVVSMHLLVLSAFRLLHV